MKRTIVLPLLLLAVTARAAPVPVKNQVDTSSLRGMPYVIFNKVAVAGEAVVDGAYAVDLYLSNYQGAQITCTGASPHVFFNLLGATNPDSDDFALGVGNVGQQEYSGPKPVNFQMAFIPMRYARGQLIGAGGNGQDTICTVDLYITRPDRDP